MRVTMCGMKTVSAALAAEEAGADYIGFVFAKKSRRFIAPKTAQEIVRELRPAQNVGVLVDAPMDEVNAIAALVGLDYVQLHGHETAETARGSERPVIKAYRYGDDFDVDAANKYPARITKPVLIAGGITAENVGEAAVIFHPFGVDVSGGLEEQGEKSEEKIRAFMEAVRRR